MKIPETIGTLTMVVLLGLAAAAQQKQAPAHPNGGGASPGASAAPMMVVDSFTHDFGEVKAGTPLRFAFKIKNEGKADLLINGVSPG